MFMLHLMTNQRMTQTSLIPGVISLAYDQQKKQA